MQPLAVVTALFQALSERAIAHCIFKSVEHLEDSLLGLTDIDLLVDERRQRDCREALISAGFRSAKSQPWARYPGIEDWVSLDPATARIVHVHLHFRLHTGLKYVKDLHLPWERDVLSSAKPHPVHGVPVIDPSLELVLLVVRSAAALPPRTAVRGAQDLGVGEGTQRELVYLREKAVPAQVGRYAHLLKDPTLARHVADMALGSGPPGGEGLLLIKARLSEEPRLHRLRTSRAKSQQLRRKAIRRGVRSGIGRALHVPSGKRLGPGGLVVGLVGSDGSGKSTVIAEVHRRLAAKVDVQRFYLGRARGPAPAFDRALSGATMRLGRGTSAARAAAGVGYALQRWLILRRSAAAAAGGSLVLLDRYPQRHLFRLFDGPMIVAEGAHWLVRWCARVERSLFASMERQPGALIMRLHVRPEVALARKPGEGAAIRAKAGLLDQLRFGHGVTVVEVDGEQPLDSVVRTVMNEIWGRLPQAPS